VRRIQALDTIRHVSRSTGTTYLPKAIGILVRFAGVGYLVNSFALLLAPAFAGMTSPAILLPALVGESSVCLWLLLKGVDLSKWDRW